MSHNRGDFLHALLNLLSKFSFFIPIDLSGYFLKKDEFKLIQLRYYFLYWEDIWRRFSENGYLIIIGSIEIQLWIQQWKHQFTKFRTRLWTVFHSNHTYIVIVTIKYIINIYHCFHFSEMIFLFMAFTFTVNLPLCGK